MIWIGVTLLSFVPSIYAQACGGSIELTPSDSSFEFQSPNYPNPQTYQWFCRWSFTAPDAVSMQIRCPVISTRGRFNCWFNPMIYSSSDGEERFCGEYRNIERSTTGSSFRVLYAYLSFRNTRSTGFTCIASASFPTATTTSSTTPDSSTSTIPSSTTPTTSSTVSMSSTPSSSTTSEMSTASSLTTSTISTTTSPRCTCGGENVVSRIVGGENALQHQFPWMVRLIISNQYLCGASLISDEWIMTAAHCVDGSTQASDITAYLGDHDKSSATETDKTLRTLGIDLIVHPRWNSQATDNDIALIKISPITFTREISPICLPFNGKDISGKVGRVSGWGTTSSGGSTPSILQWAQVNLLTAAECRDNSNYGSSITDNMNCGEDSGKDSCQGDSGGPLFLKEDGRNFEVGIVSWGRGCALANYPGVYADVQVYTDWIEETTREAFCKL